MPKSFASDNNSTVHPIIMQAIMEANKEHVLAYGDDKFTQEAKNIFKETFGENTETFFVLTGTGANVCALQAYTNRFEAVIAPKAAHINVDECGAVEHILGVKIITIETLDGKIQTESILKYLHQKGDQHHVQPKIISISQPTELGTLYTLDELKEIVQFAHEHDLKVHIDGARIANAAAALDCSLKNLTTDLGIDVLSFGGTKNGLLMGEAVIFFHPDEQINFKFIRKQNMQLLSKMRFVAAQFIPYLQKKIWHENAQRANHFTQHLYRRLILKNPEIIAIHPQTNAIFTVLPKDKAMKMQKERFFYTWDEELDVYRFMTTFDMHQQDVEDFAKFILRHLKYDPAKGNK